MSTNSIKNYISDFRFFYGWFDKYSVDNSHSVSSDADIVGTITVQVMSEYRDYLIHSHFPTKTVNRRLSTMRKFFEFALTQQWIDSNPAKGIKNVSMVNKETPVVENSLVEFESYLSSTNSDKNHTQITLNNVSEFLQIIKPKQ